MRLLLVMACIMFSVTSLAEEKSVRDEAVETARRVEKQVKVELDKAREHVRGVIKHEEKVNKKEAAKEKTLQKETN